MVLEDTLRPEKETWSQQFSCAVPKHRFYRSVKNASFFVKSKAHRAKVHPESFPERKDLPPKSSTVRSKDDGKYISLLSAKIGKPHYPHSLLDKRFYPIFLKPTILINSIFCPLSHLSRRNPRDREERGKRNRLKFHGNIKRQGLVVERRITVRCSGDSSSGSHADRGSRYNRHRDYWILDQSPGKDFRSRAVREQ